MLGSGGLKGISQNRYQNLPLSTMQEFMNQYRGALSVVVANQEDHRKLGLNENNLFYSPFNMQDDTTEQVKTYQSHQLEANVNGRSHFEGSRLKKFSQFTGLKKFYGFVGVVGVAVILASVRYRPFICVGSTDEENIRWVKSLDPPKDFNVYYLRPIGSEYVDFNFEDKFMLCSFCKILLIVENVNNFKNRNLLEKYDLARRFLIQTSTRFAFVNGTCEAFLRPLQLRSRESKKFTNLCVTDREKAFEWFVHKVATERLVGPLVRTRFLDVPPAAAQSVWFGI